MTAVAEPGHAPQWTLPSRGVVGMYSLILAESAIFTIFVVAYLFYIGKSSSGPQPRDVLQLPILNTVFLLSSSLTIHFAVKRLEAGSVRTFSLLWVLTFVLGALFLVGTMREWSRLIYNEGLTIRTNLFGTTYYSLVGLHAFHVTVGLTILSIVSIFAVLNFVNRSHAGRLRVFSMYWHFVDAVWVVVFTVVYIIGR